MTTKGESTKRPWRVARRQGDDFESVVYEQGTPNEICQCFGNHLDDNAEKCESNARLIVKAVNSHDALVDALKTCLKRMKDDGYHSDEVEQADEALKLAGED